MVAGVYCNRLYALHADNEKREVKGLEFTACSRIKTRLLDERRAEISEAEDQRCYRDSESFSHRYNLM